MTCELQVPGASVGWGKLKVPLYAFKSLANGEMFSFKFPCIESALHESIKNPTVRVEELAKSDVFLEIPWHDRKLKAQR